ncbi:MAG: tRNA guanosine(34) transglycosylase Tgt, partial [Alphaproteobacteria bacterium]|nr:tRNA guanosine(34) transglycosylase Tgt [Alphaproteobacteria bacterium]
MQFTLQHSTPLGRRGFLTTAHGVVQTPAFMPGATQGAMKAMRLPDLGTTGAEIILGNAYHLFLRPGTDVIARHGGLHGFIHWSGPILTDSGGFQVMSLSGLNKVNDDGVWFQSPIDGARHFLDPARATHIQHILDSDITMAFDQCIAYPAEKSAVEAAMLRSMAWAATCRQQFVERPGKGIFGIVQGGVFPDLRARSAEMLNQLNFHGLAIGGLAVGEGQTIMLETLAHTLPHLPLDRPRYLMGVGKPDDICHAVRAGVDMFDCVLPARSGRHGQVFVRGDGAGSAAFEHYRAINIKNAAYKESLAPLDPACSCPACRNHTAAYLHHLFRAGEMLSAQLLTWHNQQFYQDMM